MDGPLGHQWFAVASAAGIGHGAAGARLLNRGLVLWRSPDGTAIAAPDLCTHSKADLTKGDVVDGRLICPKHGWTFGDGGRCVAKPSGLPINERAHLKIYPCTERYGLIWVSLGEPATDVADVAWDGDTRYRRIHSATSVWQTNPIRIVETILRQRNSPFDDVSADLPFQVRSTFKTDDGAEHCRLLSCAPASSRAATVATVVWTSSTESARDEGIAAQALADLEAVRAEAETDPPLRPEIEITAGEVASAAEWKRRFLSFIAHVAE